MYLDNGAFGACPKVVFEKQKEIRQAIEENPHDFFERNYVSGLEASRRALAGFVHVEPADLVLVPGATHGMNIVIQSMRFQPGDEILTTNHNYSSVHLALTYVAERDGARVVVADIPLPVAGPDEVLDRILARVTPRTRFAVIDHVPSRTGFVFPIRAIVRRLAARHGVDTLVDGAHAVGMLADLDIAAIGAAYYVANCHKWMCAPRGVGFLHVRRDRADRIRPLVVARSPYVVGRARYSRLEHGFGWLGTSCPSPVLALPTCIDFLNTLVPGGGSGGLGALVARNHDLAVVARRIACRALGIPLPCPDGMIGAMATIPLPDLPGPEQEGMLPLQQTLWEEHRIVVPVYSWPAYPKRVVRLSAQAYNSLGQYLRFVDCLRSALEQERDPASRTVCCGHEDQVDWGETPRRDIRNPGAQTLFWLARQRIRSLMTNSFGVEPVALYPTAGQCLAEFASRGRPLDCQHPNLDVTKMVYMLSRVSWRRVPQVMAVQICQMLATDDVIESWARSLPVLKLQSRALLADMTCSLAASPIPDTLSFDHGKGDFASRVVTYETEHEDHNISLQFWRRALADFSNPERGRDRQSPDRVASFLQIHQFLKDPIGGLLTSRAAQAEAFATLHASLEPELAILPLGRETREAIAAQLAFETSFLSQPLARNPSYVHFCGDQQLVYAYVEIRELARTEFTCPAIVAGMMGEFLAAKGNNADEECAIAPIAVAHSFSMAHDADTAVVGRPIIIDGNNRITAIAFLRYVALHGVPDPGDTAKLKMHCREYGLGPIHFADLLSMLQMLWDGEERPDDLASLLRSSSSSPRLQRFATASHVPVLVTEEANFFTECLLLDRGVEGGRGLQPVHQSVFATDDRLAALPSKMQRHGRAKGFRAMPVRCAGGRKEGSGVRVNGLT
ncbi:pyridoxal phosphate-dependent transferase [Apiospora marii]|uniref:Pyridoxal phosphate-dependent transferase n=1 Tax=Apiospora marii TaxID=335849 RepID=A0ABR1SCP5_9PEZI